MFACLHTGDLSDKLLNNPKLTFLLTQENLLHHSWIWQHWKIRLGGRNVLGMRLYPLFPSAVVATFCSYHLDTKVHLLFCNALNSFRYQPRNYQPKLKYSHSARCCVVTASCSTLTLCFSREFSSPKPYKADQSNKLSTDVPSLCTGVRISD